MPASDGRLGGSRVAAEEAAIGCAGRRKVRIGLACDPLFHRRVLLTYRRAGRAGWLLLLAVMASVGALQMRGGIAGLRPIGPTADATSEAIFASLTGEGDVPRRLTADLAKLPEGRPVLILRPPNDLLAALPAYMVAYQSLPRPAVIRELQIADSAAAVEELRRSFAAVVFVRQPPPAAFPAGHQFGASFVFVPLSVLP